MTQRPPDPRVARTRGAIIEATRHLLATPNGASASVAQIARHAQVSVGSVYVHFESKDELVGQVIELAWEGHREAFAFAGGESSPLARVLAFGDAWLDFAVAEPVAFRALRARAVDPPAGAAVTEQTLLRQPLARLTADLAAAMDRAEIARQSPAALALLLIATWNGIAEQAVRRDGLGADPALVDAARELAQTVLLAGLRPAPVQAG